MMQISGELRFSCDGTWFYAGEEITHEKIRDYFNRHLRYSEELSQYVVEADGRCVAAIVEDTAVVVRSLDTSSSPWLALLNDDTTEPFAADTLLVNEAGPVFYCRVRNNSERARLLSPAVQKIMPLISECEKGGFQVELYGNFYPIQLGVPQAR